MDGDAVARLRYGLLWAVSIVAMIVGTSLLIAGWTTVWVPDPTNTANWIAEPVSLAGPGTGLLVGGGILVVVLLVLDTYVGPLHRRQTDADDGPE